MHCLTLSLAVDGSAFVQQSFSQEGRHYMSYTFTLAELDSWGAEDAAHHLGALMLAALSAEWKMLQRHPYWQLLPIAARRHFTRTHFKSTPTRSAHLAASVATDPDRLLVHRCTPPAVDTIAASLPLAWLVRGGADRAVELLGSAMLRALAALHPDAFAPFPALLQAGGEGR